VLVSPSVPIHEGAGELSARVRLPLVPGNYVLKSCVSRGDSLDSVALRGWQDSPSLLQIVGSRDRLRVNLSGQNPLVEVEASWNWTGDRQGQSGEERNVVGANGPAGVPLTEDPHDETDVPGPRRTSGA
jgi:hypothetical protein